MTEPIIFKSSDEYIQFLKEGTVPMNTIQTLAKQTANGRAGGAKQTKQTKRTEKTSLTESYAPLLHNTQNPYSFSTSAAQYGSMNFY